MQEVIREIIKIDKIAFENQKNNEEELERRKQAFIDEMKAYKEQKLLKANQKAEERYQQIIGEGEQIIKIEEEKAKQIKLRIENKYLQVEGQLLKEIFEKLFVTEA